MAELNSNDEMVSPSSAPVARGPIFWIGAAALLIVMAVETIAVIGRHIGWPLLGAIEILQSAILVSACAATLIATINRAHAAVHLIIDRLSAAGKRKLSIAAALLAALFFAGVCAGVTWLAIDFWAAHEETEVLHISYRPLRLLASVTTASVAMLFVYQVALALRSNK